MGVINTVTSTRPLNQEKIDHGIKYIYKYKLELDKDDKPENGNRPYEFISTFYEALSEPLDKFIELSNLVFAALYPHQENSRSNTNVRRINKITFVVRSMDGVAYTTGSQDEGSAEIHLSLNYLYDVFKNNSGTGGHGQSREKEKVKENSTATVTRTSLANTDGHTVSTVITTTVITTILADMSVSDQLSQERKRGIEALAYEICGVISHELVHAWQFSCDAVPSDLIEGIADAVRLSCGYPARHWEEKPIVDEREKGHWNRGYEKTGFFLNWIEKNIKLVDEYSKNNDTFISVLNKKLKTEYSEALFEKITSFTVNDLFLFYQINLQNQ